MSRIWTPQEVLAADPVDGAVMEWWVANPELDHLDSSYLIDHRRATYYANTPWWSAYSSEPGGRGLWTNEEEHSGKWCVLGHNPGWRFGAEWLLKNPNMYLRRDGAARAIREYLADRVVYLRSEADRLEGMRAEILDT